VTRVRQRFQAALTGVLAAGVLAAGLVAASDIAHLDPVDSRIRSEALEGATVLHAQDHGINAAGYAGDLAPAGIDVTQPVSLDVLDRRAKTIRARAATPVKGKVIGQRRHVGCVGNGTAGPRVEALYVVPANKRDRFSRVVNNLRSYIARADSVFVASARKTGGYRQLRWVHDASCRPVVRKVVVNARAASSFAATQSALASQGYSRHDRKYLIFMDAAKLCGIGSLFMDNRPGQDNFNNGFAPQYARVDAPCWGLATHSVEAHEITHTLGAVLSFAPNATAGAHCSDESDIMCYRDAPRTKIRKTCTASQEQLLDCRSDDYFSTAPRPGSKLARNWNTASSAFLYQPQRPTVAARPTPKAITGRAARVTVRTSVRSGQGWRLDWRVPAGCSLSRKRALSSQAGAARVDVRCAANRRSTVVTARVTQEDGRSGVVRVPVTFRSR
jgi:hypothetical protein